MNAPHDPSSVGAATAQKAHFDQPIRLRGGAELPAYEIAYETYGTLNAARSNAVLVCHALNASHHVAGYYEDDKDNVGWWDNLVGPGKPLDTNRFFVVGVELPRQLLRLDRAGVDQPGDRQALGRGLPGGHGRGLGRGAGAARRPARHRALRRGDRRLARRDAGAAVDARPIPNACATPSSSPRAAKLTPQNIAFNEVARQAIMTDPDFHGGHYYEQGRGAGARPAHRAHDRPHHLPLG